MFGELVVQLYLITWLRISCLLILLDYAQIRLIKILFIEFIPYIISVAFFTINYHLGMTFRSFYHSMIRILINDTKSFNILKVSGITRVHDLTETCWVHLMFQIRCVEFDQLYYWAFEFWRILTIINVRLPALFQIVQRLHFPGLN